MPLLIILSFFAGIMIYIGIVNKSIHLAVGLIVLLLEVIVYINACKEMEELKKDVKDLKNKGEWGPI
jgi:ABC-type transport system involved in cytochrome bd biosynthesis fused ATPase/permease subunit